jgi:hypothetical protein
MIDRFIIFRMMRLPAGPKRFDRWDRAAENSDDKNFEQALAHCDGQIYGARGAAALPGTKPTTQWLRIGTLSIIIE